MIKKLTLMTTLLGCAPNAMATDDNLTKPDSTVPAVKFVVYYKEEPVKVLYNTPLPAAPTSTIARIKLDEYQKRFISEKADPQAPGYFLGFSLHMIPKDVLRIIGRFSENIPGMSGVNRFFRSFGYGVIKSLPCGFAKSDDWTAIKAGKNPFNNASSIEELHLTQLSKEDLIALGFIGEKTDDELASDRFITMWEQYNHLLPKPVEVPCLLLTQTFPKIKRLVLVENLSLKSQARDLMRKRHIKKRSVKIHKQAGKLFAKRFFIVPEMRCLETMLSSYHGTEMVSQLLIKMLDGRRILEENLKVLSTVCWNMTKLQPDWYNF